jgi:Skp family chaperone for outer membrane proteins
MKAPILHARCTLIRWIRRRFTLWLVIAIATPAAAASRPYLDRVGQLKIGMSAAEVRELLGDPDFELAVPEGKSSRAWYYRLSTLAVNDSTRTTATTDLFTSVARLRCTINDDRLAAMAGIWPRPTRPPSGTPKSKIMLVDVVKVYDEMAATKKFNARIQETDATADAEVQRMNEEGKLLVERYRRVEAQLKVPGMPGEELQRSRADNEKLLAAIHAKQSEIQTFIERAKAAQNERVARRIDVCLPALSEAIMLYQKQHGFAFAYESPRNVLAAGSKPLLVKGTDVTKSLIEWIDAGHAQSVGL